IAQRVGDFLDRRRPGLLEVVGAAVDRIPLGDVLDRIGDRVGELPHARAGWEGVGTAAYVLLVAVVVRGGHDLVHCDALILGCDGKALSTLWRPNDRRRCASATAGRARAAGARMSPTCRALYVRGWLPAAALDDGRPVRSGLG